MGGGRHGGWGGGRHGGPNATGGPEGPGGPGESGERGGPSGPGGRNPAMRFLARPPLVMQVEQSDSAVFLSERDTTLMTLLLKENGEPQDSAEGPATLNAHWKGRRLEAEGQGPRGGKLSESYELGKDGKQLIVTGRVERPYGPAVELKLVYDRHEGD